MSTVNFAPDRIYAQYRVHPKTVQWYGITPTLALEICNVYQDIRNTYDIDLSIGEQLNIIGRLVGVSRNFEKFIAFDSLLWGQTISGSLIQWGGVDTQWESTGKFVTEEVSDDVYKLILKSKISKNNLNTTLDDIVESIIFITGTDTPIRVIDSEDMSFKVSFQDALDDQSRSVLNTFDVVPRPQGVKYNGFVEYGALIEWGGDEIQWGKDQWGQYRPEFI